MLYEKSVAIKILPHVLVNTLVISRGEHRITSIKNMARDFVHFQALVSRLCQYAYDFVIVVHKKSRNSLFG